MNDLESMPSSNAADDERSSVRAGNGLRLAGTLSPNVVVALERRLALLDELDTLTERRVELVRSAQLLGGHDNGDRPAPAGAGDARHRLTTALGTITELERKFDALKRSTNEATR